MWVMAPLGKLVRNVSQRSRTNNPRTPNHDSLGQRVARVRIALRTRTAAHGEVQVIIISDGKGARNEGFIPHFPSVAPDVSAGFSEHCHTGVPMKLNVFGGEPSLLKHDDHLVGM